MDNLNGGELPPEHKPPIVYPDDPFSGAPEVAPTLPPAFAAGAAGGGSQSLPPAPPDRDEDDDDEGMLRMSFLEHLEELRSRIISTLWGFGAAFLACLVFANQLWQIVMAPAKDALQRVGVPGGSLTIIDPMEGFSIIWVWTPLVASLFVASPWVLWQVWAFISPGLYHRERKWAVPFVVITAGLFLTGGLFAYFVAFRYGLAFLLGIGGFAGVVPMVSVDRYFSLFVNVMLGVSLVFELPVIIFFLTLLRIASPSFLLANSRYAILAIVVIAAVITPTPDVFNLMLFAVPMCMLFFLGVFASYMLVLKRENRRFPWRIFLRWLAVLAGMIAVVVWWAIAKYGFHLTWHWPFLIR